MSILLDMDGVLVDLVGGLVRRFKLGQGVRSYIRKRFGTKQQCPYSLTELFDCSDDDLLEALTVDFWANLKPTPWCKKLTEEICPRDSTFLCTSAGCLGMSTNRISAMPSWERNNGSLSISTPPFASRSSLPDGRCLSPAAIS